MSQRERSTAQESRVGIWITVVAAFLTVGALDHFARWPWYATYPLALVAGLVITAAYLQIKAMILGKKK